MSTDPSLQRTDAVPTDAVVKPVITRHSDSTSEKRSDRQRKLAEQKGDSVTSATGGTNSRVDSPDSVDSELVNQTKKQIRNLVSEIANLAKAETPVNEFFEGFLNRTTSALASVGGAIWLEQQGASNLELKYHINLHNTSLATDQTAQMRHSVLLANLQQSGEPTLIPPHSGSSDPNQAGNPTEYLLIIGPLKIDEKVVGLVEILQRPGAGPTTQRGYLRFLTQMCDIASDYLKTQHIRTFSDQQNLWQQVEQFIRLVHQGLDPAQTAYVIANEGRRILDCDRVSVATKHNRRCQIQAVSGLDSIERRADQVKRLSKLTSAVIRAGQPLWYSGDDSDLPPQIEKRLHEYIDKSHTKMLAVIPLNHVDEQAIADTEGTDTRKRKPLGALIVEQLKDTEVSSVLRKRVEVIADHGQLALTNANEHNSMFLMPLWKTLGKLTSPFRGNNLSRTLSCLAVATGIVAFFCLFPYPFELGAKGQLVPEQQHEIFAKVDGVLQEVFIDELEGQAPLVDANTVLARMTNNDLMVQIQNMDGQLRQSEEQIRKFKRASMDDSLETYDSILIGGELQAELEKKKSLIKELRIKREDARNLEVRAPISGMVMNWQVKQTLLRRPVTKGQNLLTLVAPNTPWRLELELPEKRVGHLLKRLNDDEDPVHVTFALASHPNKKLEGKLKRLDHKLEVHSEEGNTALMEVEFDNSQIAADLLRSGTRVNAKLNCGTRPIGYVYFHEVIETARSAAMFWF